MEQTPNSMKGPTTHKTAMVLKWALIVGIVVVLNLFFNYSVTLVYKTPTWDAFCPAEKYSTQYTTKDICVANGGLWQENTIPPDTKYTQSVPAQPEVRSFCDQTYTCGRQFNDAHKIYNRNVFILLVLFGVLSIALGSYLVSISAVSLGLSFGGVLSFIIGSFNYWSDMQDWLRVAVLGAALVALIWVAVKKIKE